MGFSLVYAREREMSPQKNMPDARIELRAACNCVPDRGTMPGTLSLHISLTTFTFLKIFLIIPYIVECEMHAKGCGRSDWRFVFGSGP